MAIKSFDACQKLSVISARNKHLCPIPHSSLEDRKWTGSKLVLLDLRDLELAKALSARGGKEVIVGTYVNSLRGFESSSLHRFSVHSLQWG